MLRGPSIRTMRSILASTKFSFGEVVVAVVCFRFIDCCSCSSVGGVVYDCNKCVNDCHVGEVCAVDVSVIVVSVFCLCVMVCIVCV